MEDNNLCKFCKQPMNEGAEVCHHCGRSQTEMTQKESANFYVQGCLIILIIILICGISFFGSIEIQKWKALKRCVPATQQQISLINEAVTVEASYNMVVGGWYVKSNELKEVYYVSTHIVGPGLDQDDEPALFLLSGPPDNPEIIMSVNYVARALAAAPDAYMLGEEITESNDGVWESLTCSRNK